MTELLHAHYLESDEAYAACAKFWRDLLNAVVAGGQCDPDQWQPWLPRHFANGMPFTRNDLPILEARNTLLDRAVRVQQWEATPDDHSGALAAWVDNYNGFDDTFPRHELFLSVLLDAAVAETASKILREWCRPDMDVDRFAAFLLTTQVEGKDTVKNGNATY